MKKLAGFLCALWAMGALLGPLYAAAWGEMVAFPTPGTYDVGENGEKTGGIPVPVETIYKNTENFTEEVGEGPVFTEDPRFEGKDWEEVVRDFLAARGIPENSVSMGYRNMVTGEERYWNGDALCLGASVYKLPLNMYFAEKVRRGELTMDTLISGWPYETIQRASLVRSDNTTGELLQAQFESYPAYRTAIGRYLGVGELPEDDLYFKNNFFSARHMIHCLRILYEDPERFPGVLDCLLQAAQDNYFALLEDRYPIAHKHGYVPYEDHLYINDCAIVYTEQPILLAMFSDTIPGGIWSISEFCRLMCDYTTYHMLRPGEDEVQPVPPEVRDTYVSPVETLVPLAVEQPGGDTEEVPGSTEQPGARESGPGERGLLLLMVTGGALVPGVLGLRRAAAGREK